MTDEYRLNLLKYLTGKINTTENTNTPVFNQAVSTYNNNLNTFITNNITGTYNLNLKMVQGKDGTGKDLESFIIVGTENLNSKSYGFIVILDKDLNPIQMIKSYTSGVRLGQIYSIKVNDDGTFYFVEYTNDTDKLRLVLVNNILVKSDSQTDYFCKLRISYNLPDAIQTTYSSIEVFKNATGSYYGFLMMRTTGILVVETLKIEVGEENVWTNYNYDIPTQIGNSLDYNSGFCYWQEDTFTFEVIGTKTATGITNAYRFYLNASSQITYDTINLSSYIYTYTLPHFTSQIIGLKHEIIGITNVELDSNDDETGNCKYSIIEVNNSTITQITTKSTTYTPNFQYVSMKLIYKNGTMFFFSYYPTSSSSSLDYGLIFNDSAYYATIQNITKSSFYYFSQTFAVTIQYNLVKYIMPISQYTGLYVVSQVFNINNFNGASYEQTKSVLPNSGNLLDSSNNIIFARNLYNKSSYGDVTISTLQIPNTMLNDKTISKNQLLSYNNNKIVDDTNYGGLTKNIYETLNINFYNRIQMWNGNDYENYGYIDNPTGAIRLNQSANSLQDLSNAMATKVRVNFDDESSDVITLNPSTQITVGSDGIITYLFTVYCPSDKTITTIEIISYDENTVYQTITGTFENDKYYSISQDVECI